MPPTIPLLGFLAWTFAAGLSLPLLFHSASPKAWWTLLFNIGSVFFLYWWMLRDAWRRGYRPGRLLRTLLILLPIPVLLVYAFRSRPPGRALALCAGLCGLWLLGLLVLAAGFYGGSLLRL